MVAEECFAIGQKFILPLSLSTCFYIYLHKESGMILSLLH